MNRSLKTNIAVLYLIGFFHSFMLVIPVFVPLLQGYGLSMSEVLQTQALFALVLAAFEVPSGYFADLLGRRQAIVVGSLLNGIGFLSLLWADTFVDFLIYEAILGVGISLISGADLALLFDSEKCLTESADGSGAGVSRSISRLISIEAGASGIAGVGASILLIWSMDLLIWVQAAVGFVPFVLSLLLIDPPRRKIHGNHASNARAVVTQLMFGKPVVLWTVLAIVAFGLLSLISFWTYQKYWELQGISVLHFGYLWAVCGLFVSVAARYSSALERLLGSRRLLVLTAVLPLLGLLGMALSKGWWGVSFCLAIQVSRGLSLTLFYEALNQRISSDFRATVNSVVSLVQRGAFILVGPVLGYMLDRYGVSITLVGLVIVFAPIFVLLIIGLTVRIRGEHAHNAQLSGA